MGWLDKITNSMDTNVSKLWEVVETGKSGMLQSKGSQRVGHDWVTEQQSDSAVLLFVIHPEGLELECS